MVRLVCLLRWFIEDTLLLFAVLPAVCGQSQEDRREFTAAVYEHVPVLPGDLRDFLDPSKALDIINSNLAIYEEQVRSAAQLKADIIVFPEDGLYGPVHIRETIYPYLEDIPDPKLTYWNPCQETERVSDFPIQRRLSCLAHQYGIYIVANMGDVKHCGVHFNPWFKVHFFKECPPDGRYQFNTNVVFDPDGTLIARYHKETLYYEEQFDQPDEVEYITFLTPFGKFGTFVCFDILFKKPAVDLVKEYEVDSIVYTTAWQSKLPLMQGVAFHEAWAVAMGVNLLSAELHLPEYNFTGSGIYVGANGALSYYANRTLGSPGKLLLTRLPAKASQPAKTVISAQPKPPLKPDTFQSELQHDLYTFVTLEGTTGQVFVSMKDTHCHLLYGFKSKQKNKLYAFGVYDGIHSSAHNSYIQVCVLLKCATLEPASCGQPILNSSSVFAYFHISGQFLTSDIFPMVVINGGGVAKEFWEFYEDIRSPKATLDSETLTHPLLSASLYGHFYERDSIGVGDAKTHNFLPDFHLAQIDELKTQIKMEPMHKASDNLAPLHKFFLVVFIVTSVVSALYSVKLLRR